MTRIDTIFSDIVARLNVLNTIPSKTIQFMFGSWQEVSNELANKGKSPSGKNFKYPVVFLDSGFTRTMFKEQRFEGSINPKIYILSDSKPGTSSTERLNTVYNLVLRPIELALVEQIRKESWFDFGSKGGHYLPEHTSQDLMYITTKSQTADIVDAIELDFKEINIKKQKCND